MGAIVVILIIVAVVFFVMKKKKKSAPQPAAEQPKAEPKNEESIKVAGVSYRQEEIKSLGELNKDYKLTKAQIKKDYPDEFIYEWVFPVYPARFEFEPDNPEDPNAIAIYIENVKIGYVKKGSTAHIRNLINSGVIDKVSCKLYGGAFKHYDSATEEFENEKSDIAAKVTITKKS